MNTLPSSDSSLAARSAQKGAARVRRSIIATLALIATTSTFAACGSSNSLPPSRFAISQATPTPGPTATTSPAGANLKVSFVIPPRTTTSAVARAPHYVSPNTDHGTVTVYQVAGDGSKTVWGTTLFSVTNNCGTDGNGATACSVTVTAPIGNDQVDLDLVDVRGRLLSTSRLDGGNPDIPAGFTDRVTVASSGTTTVVLNMLAVVDSMTTGGPTQVPVDGHGTIPVGVQYMLLDASGYRIGLVAGSTAYFYKPVTVSTSDPWGVFTTASTATHTLTNNADPDMNHALTYSGAYVATGASGNIVFSATCPSCSSAPANATLPVFGPLTLPSANNPLTAGSGINVPFTNSGAIETYTATVSGCADVTAYVGLPGGDKTGDAGYLVARWANPPQGTCTSATVTMTGNNYGQTASYTVSLVGSVAVSAQNKKRAER